MSLVIMVFGVGLLQFVYAPIFGHCNHNSYHINIIIANISTSLVRLCRLLLWCLVLDILSFEIYYHIYSTSFKIVSKYFKLIVQDIRHPSKSTKFMQKPSFFLIENIRMALRTTKKTQPERVTYVAKYQSPLKKH